MLELGLGYMGMCSDDFWSMTLHEFDLMYRGFVRRTEQENKAALLRCWYNGYFAQMDLKKIPLKKWMEQIMPEESEKQEEESLDEAKQAWEYYVSNIQGKK